MNIVFIRSNPVDPDSRVEKEVNSLIKAGHSVIVLAWDRKNDHVVSKEKLYLDSGEVIIYRIGIKASFGAGFKKNLIPLIKFQKFIFNWLTKHKKKYDVIHACDFDTAFTANICSSLLGKKLVYDIFDYYVDSFSVPKLLRNIIRFLDHTVINNADATIICSEKRKEQIKDAKPRKLIVIHNSPVMEDIEESSFSNNKVKIVYVGILAENRFLKEIAESISQDKRFEFHVGGFGLLEEYVVGMSKKYDNIKFYGKIPYKETLELERKSDILVAIYNPEVANHIYAAPNKFYEALMLGKPIIMARGTGMSEFIDDNEIGVCCDYDKEDFKMALNVVIKKRNLWQKKSEIMKKIYKEQFSWDIMEKRLLETYDFIEGKEKG